MRLEWGWGNGKQKHLDDRCTILLGGCFTCRRCGDGISQHVTVVKAGWIWIQEDPDFRQSWRLGFCYVYILLVTLVATVMCHSATDELFFSLVVNICVSCMRECMKERRNGAEELKYKEELVTRETKQHVGLRRAMNNRKSISSKRPLDVL